MAEGLRQLASDGGAKIGFCKALMAVSAQALDNLLPLETALRLLVEIDDALRRQEPEEDSDLEAFLGYDYTLKVSLAARQMPS